jgi:SNF2 family DNA or RNA helicase/ribosomal protein S17E
MAGKKFIVALTRHRYLGNIFLPYFIVNKGKFYSVVNIVKPHDFGDEEYVLQPYEKELVKIIERYSDKRLMKRFSREKNVTEFFANLESAYIRKHISPFISQCMNEIVEIIKNNPVRVFVKEAKYFNLYQEDEIFVQKDFAQPVFNFERTANETRYQLKVFCNGKEIPLKNRNIRIVADDPCIFIYRDMLISFEKMDSKKLSPFLVKDYVSVPNSMEETYYSGFIKKTIANFEVQARGFQIEEEQIKKSAVLSLENNLKYEPSLFLYFEYGDELLHPNSGRTVIVKFKKDGTEYKFHKITRDTTWESQIVYAIEKAGLREMQGYYSLPGTELMESDDALYVLINWLNINKQSLLDAGIRIEQKKLQKKYFTGEQQISFSSSYKDDWFDIYAIVTFGEFKIPFLKLKKYILNDIREFELPNGEIAIIPDEWFARYKTLLPFAKGGGDRLHFSKNHYPLLQVILQPGDKTVIDKFRELSGAGTGVKVPAGLKAQLRNYQKEGFGWMYGLYKNGFGGCLADDMGLGKTIQTLTLLMKLKRPERFAGFNINGPGSRQLDLFSDMLPGVSDQNASLIVVPTSLVHNWEDEIRKFTPDLRVYSHVGQQRRKNSDLEDAAASYDIILTTYGIIRNDAGMLSHIKFFYLILDESQYIKNPASKTYKAVMTLKSSYRLVLTGTPIENSLSDLWSQINFLNRGMLGNLSFFRRYFITPVEKHSSSDQQEKLQILIRPFILRRTKEEVAKDLPPLMEQLIMCEMGDKQKRKYETEKSIIRNSILEAIENEGVKKSSITILRGLTRLRQLANHPSLIDGDREDESGKMEEIFRMLENLIAENHKVLIFSSFVKHLELIRSRIQSFKWKYSMLTGQTVQRGEIIKDFEKDPENRIFLISLKTGGIGLNLTSADYVFIIDPWWNPAAENQAISRAHRIGQNNHVFVYRFITQNSIEEKIQQLQNRKSSLAEKFISSNNPLQAITEEEILSLFK